MINNRSIKYLIKNWIFVIIIFLIFVWYLYDLLLYFFGLSVFIVPMLIGFGYKNYIIEFFLFAYIADIITITYPSFLGTLGEIMWYCNYYTYSLGFIILFLYLFYKKFIIRNTNEDIWDYRLSPIKTNELVNIDVLLSKYNIAGYVKSTKEGPFITKYIVQLDSSVSALRFEGLSVEFSQELGRKVINRFFLDEVFIEVENINKNPPILRETYVFKQPNHISIMDSTGNVMVFHYMRNLLIFVNDDILISILCGIMITKSQMDLVLINGNLLNFTSIYQLVNSSINEYLLSIVNEINKRYSIMLPYGRNIDEYDSIETIRTLQKFPRKILVIFEAYQLERSYIEYIIQYGNKVGIYLYCINDKSFMDLLNYQLFDYTMNTNLANKLCGDCLFISEKKPIRLSIPIVSPEEQIRLITYYKSNQYLT